ELAGGRNEARIHQTGDGGTGCELDPLFQANPLADFIRPILAVVVHPIGVFRESDAGVDVDPGISAVITAPNAFVLPGNCVVVFAVAIPVKIASYGRIDAAWVEGIGHQVGD